MPLIRKIAFVQNSFWYAWHFRLPIMRTLRDQGFLLYVIAPESKTEQEACEALASEGFQLLPIRVRPYFHGLRNESDWLYQLWRIYRRESFHLCLHYTIKANIYGTMAAACTQTPSIAITTGLGILRQREHRLSGRILCALYRLALRSSREVWFLNEDDRSFFLRKKICPSQQTFVLPGEGIDTRYFSPYPQTNSPTAGTVHFLFIGRLLWSKGLNELSKAASYFRDRGLPVYFEIIGVPGEQHPDAVSSALLTRWEQEDLIRYWGSISDIRPYLASADALVLPSHSEGLSRVLLEAGSMGIPVISSDVAGCRQVVVEGETGFLCTPANYHSLIQTMQHFIQLSQADRIRLGQTARQFILSTYAQERVTDAFLQRVRPYLHPSPNHSSHVLSHYCPGAPTSCPTA